MCVYGHAHVCVLHVCVLQWGCNPLPQSFFPLCYCSCSPENPLHKMSRPREMRQRQETKGLSVLFPSPLHNITSASLMMERQARWVGRRLTRWLAQDSWDGPLNPWGFCSHLLTLSPITPPCKICYPSYSTKWSLNPRSLLSSLLISQ